MMCSVWRFAKYGAVAAILACCPTARAQDGLADDLDDLLGVGDQPAAPVVEPAAPAAAPAAEPAVPAAAPAAAPAAEPAAEPAVPAVEPAVPAAEPAVPAPPAADPFKDLFGDPAAPAVTPAAPAVEPAAAPATPAADPFGEPVATPATPTPAAAAAPAAAPAAEVAKVVSEIDTLEQSRRRALEAHGRTSLINARQALKEGNYPESQVLYEQALKFIGARPGNELLRDEAEKGIAESIYRQANVLWKKGDRERAIQLARQAREKGHPKAPKLISSLQYEIDNPPKPEPPKEAKRWHAEEYRANREEAARGLVKAREFYITGEYDLARAELELILRDNPYDQDALQMLQRVNERTYDVSSVERDTTRTRMIRDVRDTWNPRRYAIDTVQLTHKLGGEPTEGTVVGERGITAEQATIEKMKGITIPEINFRAANINDVIAFFETASREFDSPEIPPEKRGISFVLKLSSGGAAAPAAPVADDPFAPAPAAATGGVSPVTFSARYVTLFDALQIVTDVAGLKFRVRGPVVMVMPVNVPDRDMITRSYTVLPSLEERAAGVSRELGASARGGAPAAGGGFMEPANVAETGAVDWKKFFQDMGVSWPDGSSVAYIQSIGKLRVLNTPENLTILESLLEELNVTPRQIEIEARFVEVSQTDLESIGFEWLLSDDWEVAQKDGGLSPASTQRIQIKAGSGTTGLRYLTDPDVDTAIGTVADNVISAASVLTNPELSFILHLLSQRANTDLLSAPKVVTKNGQEAIIKVVTEYIYPTQFDVETIETTTAVGATTRTAPTAGLVEPSGFEMREVGVILQVVPDVSPDGQMIDLFLNPQIVSEPEWKNYGTTYTDDTGYTYSLNMEQPFFKVRSISTHISIYNGATVVMGGMITELRSEVDDKVPLLGDIPLVGRLFRSRYDHSEKRNLLIFVTARLVDPAGRSLKTMDEKPTLTAEAIGGATTPSVAP